MIARFAALVAALLAFAACGTSMVAPPCRLGVEHDVGAVIATSVDQLDVVATRRGALVAWSSAEGTWARALDGTARPVAPAQRLAPFARGGLALAVTRRAQREVVGLLVVEPGDTSGRYGAVRLLELDDLGAPIADPIHVGAAGVYSDGAALAASPRGWVAAWHDGAPGAFRVRVAELDHDGRVSPRGGRVIASEGRSAWSPSIGTHAGRWVITWQETWFDERRREAGVLRAHEHGRTRDAREVARPEAGPSATWFGGRWILSYRDNRDRDRHAEYYVGPLGAARHRAPSASDDERISRANGPRPPRLVACGPILLGVAVRSFARNMLVGVNRIGDGLAKRGGELQIYEELQGLSRAATTCRTVRDDASELVIAYAEQGVAARPERHVRAAAMHCER